ncbi:MAG: 23S rRNA (adenine(2503)-C(2))-methyltransferase RlmN, partial [Gammaproteobacteria bacterium]
MTATSPDRTNLLGLTLQKMETFFTDMGEKRFRAAQVVQWIHQNGADDFGQMTNISKHLRAQLAELTAISVPEIVSDHTASDGTRKWVLRVNGGSNIETVYIPDGNRGTLCISSQVGCQLNCSFCSTARQGFNRNLSAAEIIGQVWIAQRLLDEPATRAQA